MQSRPHAYDSFQHLSLSIFTNNGTFCAKSSVIVPETFLFLNEKENTKFSHFASILR